DVLTKKAIEAPHIEIRERTVALKLLTSEGAIVGVSAWDAEAERHVGFAARNVVMTTGSMGGLYAVTTNPLYAQGHGLTMAYEAGARLRDLEFVQFHPTALDIGVDPAPLATEAIRGDGATLHDAHGRRFMPALHKDAELAPRDIVARGVARAIAETGQAFLDARRSVGHQFPVRFPTVYRSCKKAGIDPVTHPMPIAPAAHYHMGGIETDTDGRTTLDGLWAVGECASVGIHGANRLASNSLLEAMVFGERAARPSRRYHQPPHMRSPQSHRPCRPVRRKIWTVSGRAWPPNAACCDRRPASRHCLTRSTEPFR
ncbi:MAG: FAD-binding protein, partial [Pseudomonadota bacterium]